MNYSDSDPDAYLCEPCQAIKRNIAKDIDAQFSVRPRVEPISDLKQHEMNGQSINVNGRMVTFAKA